MTWTVLSYWGRVFLVGESGTVSLCSRVLLLSLGIPPTPAPARFAFSPTRTVKFGGCMEMGGCTIKAEGVGLLAGWYFRVYVRVRLLRREPSTRGWGVGLVVHR